MSFDTTANNSDAVKGAAVLIEQDMSKDLLQLACRHHIFEVLLGEVFNSIAGPSSGPDIQIFTRFKNEWQSINHDSNSIISGIADEETAVCINQELVNEVVQFARKCLQEKTQPLADYMELLELSLIYMGHVFSKRYSSDVSWDHVQNQKDDKGHILAQDFLFQILILLDQS